MLYKAVKTKSLFKLDKLTWGFVRPKKPTDRQLAYAESFWICKYIEETNRHDVILKMLAEFKAGLGQEEVFRGSEANFDEIFRDMGFGGFRDIFEQFFGGGRRGGSFGDDLFGFGGSNTCLVLKAV